MRMAPIGVLFADDLDRVIREAEVASTSASRLSSLAAVCVQSPTRLREAWIGRRNTLSAVNGPASRVGSPRRYHLRLSKSRR